MNTDSKIFAAFVMCVVLGPVTVASPLFDTSEILELTIEAPIREIIRKRLAKPVHDAVVRYTDSSGTEIVIHGQLTSRGNARLEVCDFPPLRLILNETETAGTIFEGQDRLKMVTQCNKRKDGQTWLLQELGIYRAYNVITDYSYRVRRLNVTYLDSDSSNWKRTQPAFFIEPTGVLADRMQLESIRPPTINSGQYNLTELTNNILFQMLIANTDFSAKRGSSGEGCCHNARVLTEPGKQMNWFVVPYDFDQAGIINTKYALADKRLGIRNVRSRLYRGFCWQNDSLPAAIELLRERREAITVALIPMEVSSTRKKRLKQYVNGFYEIIDDPAELQKRIKDECRGPDSISIRKTTTS